MDLPLNDGRTMPALGFGTWRVPEAAVGDVVRAAAAAGFRLLDTAALYGNEAGIGAALRTVPPLFTVTKLWNDRHGDAPRALEESLARLRLDAIDLYLIHWPVPARGGFVAAWRALVALRTAGLARSIGVSNFLPDHIAAIADATGVLPAVNQVELHPRFQQRTLRAFHARHGIVTQCWSPQGIGGALNDPAIGAIAARVRQTPSQVVLRWHLQHGLAPIPRSGNPAHLAENAGVTGWELDAKAMATIDALDDPAGRIGRHPLEMV